MLRIPDSFFISSALILALLATASGQTNATREGNLNSSVKSQSSETAVPANNDTRAKSDEKSEASKRVDKVARENARRQYKAGIKYGRANLFRQAQQSFQQAIESDPDFADAHFALGQAYFDLGEYEKAVGAFQKAIKLNPQLEGAYTALGGAVAKLDEQKRKGASGAVATVVPTTNDASPTEAAKRESENAKDELDLTRVYRVGAGDVLDVRIPGSSGGDESTLFTVSASGQLDHPLVGHTLRVSGLTTEEIASQLNEELKKRSIGGGSSPEVAVRDYNSHTVLVSGLVKEPGTKIIRREAIPLYVVLADAQPLPEAALAAVLSRTSGTRTVDISNAEQTTLLIRPGDVVTIQPAMKQFFYVGGDVKAPGELPFRSGLTLTQAILSAGGVRLKGNKVQLTRGQGNGLLTSQEFKLNDINKGKTADPVIQPGDRITVLP
ncbi:MAG TPA: tetratricopeptide repeat protein [Pyrinomonadaceae bacterium]